MPNRETIAPSIHDASVLLGRQTASSALRPPPLVRRPLNLACSLALAVVGPAKCRIEPLRGDELSYRERRAADVAADFFIGQLQGDSKLIFGLYVNGQAEVAIRTNACSVRGV